MSEYCRYKFDGKTPLPAWEKMPSTMIRKVALVQALREAFPEDLGGLYSQEEMPVDVSTLPQNNPCEGNNSCEENNSSEEIKIITEYISKKERAELFNKVKNDNDLLKKVISNCGYTNTQTIPKAEYIKVCEEIENALNLKNMSESA